MTISRQMADLAERMADEGYGADAIAKELRGVADAEEHGWLGTKYVAVIAGVVEEPWQDAELMSANEALSNIHDLITDRKTVSVAKIREALGEDE